MNTKDLDIIDWLLSNETSIDTTPLPSIKEWKKKHDAGTCKWADPVDRAIAGGFLADRIAYAFAAGYNTALQKMFPSLPLVAIAAICVTEKQGGHPRVIKTKLEQQDHKPLWRLSGAKQFVTSAVDATHLLVAASTGTGEDGKNHLKIVLLEAGAKGLSIVPMENPLPFIPEIGMGGIELKDVEVHDSQLLQGDGYSAYIKPFRTIEDLQITGAMLGHIYRTSCLFAWPRDIKERIFSLMSVVKVITGIEPLRPHGHIAMGGLFRHMADLMHKIEPLWEKTPKEIKDRWHRDKVIINTADKVREKRLASAWAHYAM